MIQGPRHVGDPELRLHVGGDARDHQVSLCRHRGPSRKREVDVSAEPPAGDVLRPRLRVVKLHELELAPVDPLRGVVEDFRDRDPAASRGWFRRFVGQFLAGWKLWNVDRNICRGGVHRAVAVAHPNRVVAVLIPLRGTEGESCRSRARDDLTIEEPLEIQRLSPGGGDLDLELLTAIPGSLRLRCDHRRPVRIDPARRQLETVDRRLRQTGRVGHLKAAAGGRRDLENQRERVIVDQRVLEIHGGARRVAASTAHRPHLVRSVTSARIPSIERELVDLGRVQAAEPERQKTGR